MFKRFFLWSVLLGLFLVQSVEAQENLSDSTAKITNTSTDTVAKQVLMIDGKPMTDKQIRRYYKQMRRDSIRKTKNIWWSALDGPS